jgi:hypothetical protein
VTPPPRAQAIDLARIVTPLPLISLPESNRIQALAQARPAAAAPPAADKRCIFGFGFDLELSMRPGYILERAAAPQCSTES